MIRRAAARICLAAFGIALINGCATKAAPPANARPCTGPMVDVGDSVPMLVCTCDGHAVNFDGHDCAALRDASAE